MAGYSDTPLVKKLGLKAGHTMIVKNPPMEYFDLLSPMPVNVKVRSRWSSQTDFIHIFCMSQKEFFELFQKSKQNLKKDGLIWVSWPKKASKIETDLDENIIRNFGLRTGLVDVKVCAVDDTWSGLKFVYRTKDR